MSLKYYLGSIVALPLLPIIFLQGKKIRTNVPKLPEARDPEGYVKKNSSKTIEILCIGESTIAGVGVDFHKNGFIGALANTISDTKAISVAWKVYAKSGYTAKMVREKIVPTIKENRTDLIIIGLGGNDAFRLHSPKVWIEEIEQLITKLQVKFPKTPIYFTNMPPIKEFPAFTKSIKFVIGNLVELLGNHLYRIIKNKDNVYYNNEIITLKSWQEKYKLSGDISTFFSDGVHPSKLTYQLWGKDMAKFILKK
ncbi:MAG: SGNH/GDSL hydrolase family protein [Polaribacter sp.]|jgi:lysophospholipase L1-like esterase